MNIGLLIANVLGALIYLWGTSRGGWVISAECQQGIRTITGEPYIWALTAIPAYAIFFIINLLWSIFILRRRDWRFGGRLWLLGVLIWVVAVWIDFTHHAC